MSRSAPFSARPVSRPGGDRRGGLRQLDLLPLLSGGEIERLLAEGNADARVEVAEQVGQLIAEAPLSEMERALANDIVEVLSRDLERTVREAVARTLKDCPLLPRKIARRLAEDAESVALPILKASEVLSEAELIELVRGGNLAKQIAIAGRRVVQSALSDALIDTRREPVILTLLENPGADISEPGLHRIIDLMAENEAVRQAIAQRLYLPLTIQQRLIGALSRELCDQLDRRHPVPASVIEQFVSQGSEGALTRMIRRERRVEEVEKLVERLHAGGRLTATLVLRALLEGDLHLFEAAVARLARVPTKNARAVIHYGGRTGLRRLYDRTGLPSELFTAIRISVEVVRDLEVGGDRRLPKQESEALSARIIGRIVESYREVYPAPLETVLGQLGLNAGTAGGRGG